MRLPVHRVPTGVKFNMTPMIDVVFLLIIFFLVSSHLARQEVQLELDLPRATTGEETLAESNPRVTVNVRGDGELLLGGATVTRGQLQQRLRFEHERLGENIEVRVRGDRGVPYQHVEPVLIACAHSGIWNVTFAVIQRE